MLSVPTGRVLLVYAAVPVPSSVTVPSVVEPLRKVAVPVGIVLVPLGGATTAVSVTLPPEPMLVALAVSVVTEVRGVGGATVVIVSATVFAPSTFPAASVAML